MQKIFATFSTSPLVLSQIEVTRGIAIPNASYPERPAGSFTENEELNQTSSLSGVRQAPRVIMPK